MDEVLRLLEARRWDKYCRRTNIATPDLIEGDTFKRARLQSNKIRPNEHKLLEAIKAIAPEWHENTEVILNRDVQCKCHRDGANLDHSWILWLGDFDGGALCFDDGRRIEGTNTWHCFSGQDYHWNEPHTGRKYSVVLYRPTRESCARQIARRRRAQTLSTFSDLPEADQGKQGNDLRCSSVST